MTHAGVNEEWAVGYQVEFTDGGPALRCILGFGTEEQAERAVERIPLASAPYSGPRPALAASLFACPAHELPNLR